MSTLVIYLFLWLLFAVLLVLVVGGILVGLFNLFWKGCDDEGLVAEAREEKRHGRDTPIPGDGDEV